MRVYIFICIFIRSSGDHFVIDVFMSLMQPLWVVQSINY